MSLRYRRKILAVALESTYGTEAVPTGSQAILAKDIELTALAGDTVSRELETPYYGNSGQIQVNSHQSISFKVELSGAGTAAEVPPWGVLLRGCGMAETLTADDASTDNSNEAQVTYTPISEAEESLTLYINRDGQLHRLLGARGTWSLELASNAIPYLSFTFTGLWADPASASPLTPDYSPFQPPKIGSRQNTPTASLHGQALALSTFSYEHTNEVTHRELIGADNQVLITGRSPTGSVTVDEPPLSQRNYFMIARAGATGTLLLQHGQTTGHIIEFRAPKVEINNPQLSEASGISQLQLNLAMLPVSGNDELSLTVK